jgi:translocation and assembly module TamB
LSDVEDHDSKPASAAEPKRRARVHLSLLAELVIALVVLLAVVGLVRFGPLTAPGRAALMDYLDGTSLGPWGRLHASGLHGDIWRDFTIDRLSVNDPQGAWLDVQNLRLRWRPLDLVRRRFHAQAITADKVSIYRRPILGRAPPPTGANAPLAVLIDSVKLRLESRPAFSVRPGLFDIAASFAANRSGGFGGTLKLQSLTRSGDGLDARFDMGLTRRLVIVAEAREGDGGAIAGALGLPANRPFTLSANADGTKAEGRFHLRATSGDTVPASADGAWDKTAGWAKVGISLAASTLTAPYAQAIGPQVGLAVKGRGAGGAIFDMAVAVQAQNLTAQASGLLDRDHLTAPKGLRLAAEVKDLTRVTAAPAMGSGSFNGTMAGGLSDWKLAGVVGVTKLGAYGYSLSRAEGPVALSLAKGEYRLKTELAGQGGAGQGLVAALGGARPRASLEGSVLSDGRVLVRAFSADGAGLHVTATGDRNLLGGLNLKGDLKLSNLAAAQPGASGLISATWSAVQARPTSPWSLNLNAQGQALASGYQEVDRLLGPRPGLRLQVDYATDGGVAVNAAQLTGAAANLGAKGLIGKAGDLKLALDWTAQGPFEAGPLQISGKASGNGALTGTWAAPKADLISDVEQVALPYLTLKPAHLVLSFARTGADTDGLIAVHAGSSYGPAHIKAGFRFLEGGVELKDIDADAGGLRAEGSLALRQAAPSSADLTLALGAGAFASAGSASARVKIVEAGGGATGSIKLSADDLIPRDSGVVIRSARFSADGPLTKLPYHIDAQAATNGAPIRLNGTGVLAQQAGGLAVSFAGGGRVRKADFHTVTPAQFTFGPAQTGRLSLALGGGRAELTAHEDSESLSAKGTLSGVDLGALGEDLAGKFDADFVLDGRGPILGGSLNAKLEGARSRDAASTQGLSGTIKAALSGDHLTLDATGAGAQSGGRANVTVTVPAEASAAPFKLAINGTRPIQGHFDADAELQPLWDLFFGGDRSLAGRLVAQGALGGTVNSPVLVGHAALSNGKLEDAPTGLKLRNMTADIDLTSNMVSVQRFSASDAKQGTVTGDGRLSLVRNGESTLTLNVKSFQLIDNDTAKATASGTVTVTRGGDGKARLAGRLNIDHAEISAINRTPPGVVGLDVIERNRPVGEDEIAPPSAPPSGGSAVAFDIQLRADQGIYLKGLGLSAEMSLSADVTGDSSAPQLSGTARVIRGAYDFAGKRFDIDNSSVVYLDTSPDRIRLDLSATRDDPTLTAVIQIKGTAAKPRITLTSTPTLPSDEVLSQVLFGKSAAQLSGVEAAQLAAAVTTLATGGGFDVIGGLRNFVRLDRLALGSDTLGAPTVSGGKYVSEHVYLEVTGGGKEGPSAQVAVNAGHGLTVTSQVGGLEGTKLAISWRLNYGKAKPKQTGKEPAKP